MSAHTYIGARYVPRFLGTYDPTQAYEALDVVDNGSGTSYISRIPTPPGTPLTDSDHWALYGSSSAAIASLTTRVDTLENDLPNKQDKGTYNILSFTGATLEDKFHAALDYVKANGFNATIICNEEIDITTAYDLGLTGSPQYDTSFGSVIIVGAKFKLSSQPIFTSSESIAYCPIFQCCEFFSNSSSYILDNAVNSNFINPFFIGCLFVSTGLVNNADLNTSIYVQSVKLIGCKIIRTDTPFIRSSNTYDSTISDCQFETSTAALIELTRSCNKLSIVNCCIEGFTATPIILTRGVIATIRDNYFEDNKPHCIDINGSTAIYKLIIEGNLFFNVPTGNAPIQVDSGNNTNENIIIDNNEMTCTDSATYLCNLEPYSTKKYGIDHNRRLVSGVLDRHNYPGRNTLGIQNGWFTTADWYYDSGADCYKTVIDIWGSLDTRLPFVVGCLRGLSRANQSGGYTLNVMFMLTLVKTNVGGTPAYDVVVEDVINAVGTGSGTLNNASIVGTLTVDPDDSSHHMITVSVTCPSQYLSGIDVTGRICDLMQVGMFEYVNPS